VPAPDSNAAALLDDQALLTGFEKLALPIEAWTHQSHVRVAMMYAARFGFQRGLERMRAGIQAFNGAKGVKNSRSEGYHETLTVAWFTVIAAALEVNSRAPANSLEFVRLNPQLLDKTLLRRHYTSDRMQTEEAKQGFVAPDLEPLPALLGNRPNLAPKLPSAAGG
jgi:hypothetical protein